MNSAQQREAVAVEVIFLNSIFILSILYDANIERFFEKPNLFGMSLDKSNL
jgi:hypothetical protein